MRVNRLRQNVFPLLAAFIWGTAFVAQSVSTDYVGPFTFNMSRAVIATVFLFCLDRVMRTLRAKRGEAQPAFSWKNLMAGGICCGVPLAVASNLQQKGLETTGAGKAGFITALYIVLVPIFGIAFKRRAPRGIWFSVALAVVGLYFLCIKAGESMQATEGDIYLLLCAVCFTIQILAADHFVQFVDGVELSCAQFFVVMILSGCGVAAFEHPTRENLMICLIPILYAGLMSSGVAYTLQILAQKDSNPTVVSLILSLESVFATLSGAVLLHDKMSGREYIGCLLMAAAVVLAQLPSKEEKNA